MKIKLVVNISMAHFNLYKGRGFQEPLDRPIDGDKVAEIMHNIAKVFEKNNPTRSEMSGWYIPIHGPGGAIIGRLDITE